MPSDADASTDDVNHDADAASRHARANARQVEYLWAALAQRQQRAGVSPTPDLQAPEPDAPVT
ncbi:hypothetical protein [Deinococcus maricopensis]|uniref:Putative ribonuclease n=1 Tax=Deinococcus maricopensis (strain DSM 21211 / LMG 22137 / NRRL B-23946 / LB-34) TaxID=709986 RepID=E8U7D4_DEIML|nr:hypothetical protein [Deinococcus maricopensis]ADV66973.1 putative ribonuclease [Deinococcus maricopensis DSM 21211]